MTSQHDKLLQEIAELQRRAIRVETRLCKLLVHFGLDDKGVVPHNIERLSKCNTI